MPFVSPKGYKYIILEYFQFVNSLFGNIPKRKEKSCLTLLLIISQKRVLQEPK